MTAPDLGVFDGVDLWIFDLDNTLYPRPDGLWREVHAKMQQFIGDLLGLDQKGSERIQTDYFKKYGLTMRGLMKHHDVDPDAYNAYVHDVDLSEIEPNPALGAAIAALPGRRVIHTNSDMGHTGRVLEKLGIADAFDAAYDIKFTDYVPKPDRLPFDSVLAVEGGDGRRAAMFEDSARNLVVPHGLGMRTVFVPSPCEVASEGADADHVHFVAEDLTHFLESLTKQRAVV